MKPAKFIGMLLLVLLATPFAGIALTLGLCIGAIHQSWLQGRTVARRLWGEA